MKIFYNGREIPEAYARMLEDSGQAHLSSGGGGEVVMERGPGNNWLEKQDPNVFLQHVFGHTCTWREMATKWGRDGEHGMDVVAECMQALNTIMLATLTERRERAGGEAKALASRT